MGKSQLGVTPMSENVADWYNDVVFKADLADNGPARGTMIMKPYGYGIWELLQGEMDRRFKDTGHVNAAFPLFIPMSFFEKEAEHVDGFAPELAVVTHAGGKELGEPLVVRPTSETVILDAYSRWISSHRDLPVLINQWGNVVRWELRPRMFLRTTEFLWQEGHTAHATEEDARDETMTMLDVYEQVARDVGAIPVIPGMKTDGERFPGAVETHTIEGMMRDGKALQSGTSHYFGTRFSEPFDITFQDADGELKHVHTTSWGMSTRMVGAIILAHGDDAGLVLPPRVAPTQVVLIPIGRGEDGEATRVKAAEIADQLRAVGVRVDVDDRDQSPGRRIMDAELKGIPFRAELGPRDLEAGHVLVAPRIGETDEKGFPVKTEVAFDAFVSGMAQRLDDYHDHLLARARDFRDEHTADVDDWDTFVDQVAVGFANVLHCGRPECEDEIKAETKATPRCIPAAADAADGTCVRCDNASAYGQRIIFSRAY